MPRLLVLVLALCAPAGAWGADKGFVYAQKAGKLTIDRKEVGAGYSGRGEGGRQP